MNKQNEINKWLENRQKVVRNLSIIALIGFIVTSILLFVSLTNVEFTIELNYPPYYSTNWVSVAPVVLLCIFNVAFVSSFFLMTFLYFKTKHPSQEEKRDSGDWRFSIAVVGTFILLIASILMIIGISFIQIQSSFQIALIIIFGVVTLLSSLVLASVVLKILKLENPNEALGLPPGSVRAIIALMLIIIFAITSMYMYSALSRPQETQIIMQISNYTRSNGEVVWSNRTTITRPGMSEDVIDFSKQTLTTLSTLVVALAAFYFGTRSVAQAQKTEPEVSLSINPSSPVELKLDENQTIDTIRVTTIPKDEQIKFSLENDPDGRIIPSSDPNVFSYEPSKKLKDQLEKTKESKLVILKFWMTKYPEDKEELKVRIEPKNKPTLQQQIANLEDEISKLEEREAGINKQIDDKQKEIETIEKQIKTEQKTEEQNKEKIQKLKEEKENIQKQIEERKSRRDKVTAEKEKKRQELENLRKQLSEKPEKEK